MRASEFGHEDVVECLIVHGAGLDFISEGETAFTKAARFNHPGVMNVMFSLGTKVHHQHWWTLLHAASEGHVDVARLLLDNGVDANFRLTTHDEIPGFASQYVGQTAVYLAVGGQHADMVVLLVDSGANIHGATDYDKGPLQHLALKWPYLSPKEEMCLYELCGRSWRRKMWWKLCRVSAVFVGAFSLIGFFLFQCVFVICLISLQLFMSPIGMLYVYFYPPRWMTSQVFRNLFFIFIFFCWRTPIGMLYIYFYSPQWITSPVFWTLFVIFLLGRIPQRRQFVA